MNEQAWLNDELMAVAQRLTAEGAEGVILSAYYVDTDKNYTRVCASGMLSLTDGLELSEHVMEYLVKNKPIPTPEATQ